MTHDHGSTARLLDEVWCLTCQHTHIATIPAVTFRCTGGPDHGCGFGVWTADIAEQHATDYPDHIVHPVLHQTVPMPPTPPAYRMGDDRPEGWDFLMLDGDGTVLCGWDDVGCFHQWAPTEVLARAFADVITEAVTHA